MKTCPEKSTCRRTLGWIATAALLLACRQEAVSATAVYAVTKAGSLYKSTDAAKSWQPVPIAGTHAATYTSALAIDPQNPGAIYLTLVETITSKPSPNGPQPLRALFRSADGGQSWSQTSGISPSHVTVDPTSPNTIYADAGQGFVRSTDSGATFGSFTLNLSISGIGADPRQAGMVYATAVDSSRSLGVYNSTDFGSTWTSLGNLAGGIRPAGPRRWRDSMSPSTRVTAASFMSRWQAPVPPA